MNQDINQFVTAVLKRAKDGRRAIFLVESKGTSAYVDYPFKGTSYNRLMDSKPDSLIGVYSSRAQPDWILEDCR